MTESTTLPQPEGFNELVATKFWPDGVTKEFFLRVVAASETAYLANGKGRLPDIQQVVTYMGGTPSKDKVGRVLVSKEYKSSMADRGINVTSKTLGITPEQSYALQIMTDPSRSRISFANRLKQAGVTYQKWRSWMQQPLFSTAFSNLTETTLNDSIGIAHTALVGKAAEGDMRAIEYLHQITGRFDPQREANMNMNAILLGILEILTTRITDRQTLELISRDMEQLVGGQPPRAVGAFSEQPLEVEVVSENANGEVAKSNGHSVFAFNKGQ